MRTTALLPLVALAAQTTAVYITRTITDIEFIFRVLLDSVPYVLTDCFRSYSVCWTNPVGPTVTQTVPGATTTTTNTAGTLTETATIEAISGVATYTIQPTPPARMVRRAKTTVITTEVCSATSALTLYPTTTYSDPTITSTITSYGHTATVTFTTSFIFG